MVASFNLKLSEVGIKRRWRWKRTFREIPVITGIETHVKHVIILKIIQFFNF